MVETKGLVKSHATLLIPFFEDPLILEMIDPLESFISKIITDFFSEFSLSS